MSHPFVLCLLNHFKKKKIPKKERSSGKSLLLFFFSKVFVIVVAHIEVKGMDTVSLGDVKAIVLS